jgi:hypothetical protein
VDGFEIRKQRGDDPRFFMEGYNRAKLLIKRIAANKIAPHSADSSEKQEKPEYIEFINSDMMQYPAPESPIEEIERLKTENPTIGLDDGNLFETALIDAQNGNAQAMYEIAFHCFNNVGDISDNRKMVAFALYYFHKAIRSGHKGAMYNLGSIYYHGDNRVPIDRNKAYYLYLYSDVRIAQGELGVYYAKGEIVEQDYEKAFLCFTKCALLKINACYGSLSNLARMYRNGIYVEVDEKFAEHLETLSKKAEKGGAEVGE